MPGSRITVADVVEDHAGIPTHSGRSRLYRWMRLHHDELLERWSNTRIDWAATSERFGLKGLTDRSGQPPSAQTAKKTWQRVRRDIELARAKGNRASKHPSASETEIDLATTECPDGTDAMPVVRSAPAEPEDQEPPRRFQLAILRGMAPPQNAAEPSARPTQPQDHEHERDPDAVLAEFFGDPRSGSKPTSRKEKDDGSKDAG